MKSQLLILAFLLLPCLSHAAIVFDKISEGQWTLLGVDGDGHPSCIFETHDEDSAMRLSVSVYQQGPVYMSMTIRNNAWNGNTWTYDVFDSGAVFSTGTKKDRPSLQYSWAQKYQSHTLIIRDVGEGMIRRMQSNLYLNVYPQVYIDASSCKLVNQSEWEHSKVFVLDGFDRLWGDHVQACMDAVKPYATVAGRPTNTLTLWPNYYPGKTWTNPHPNCHSSEAD